MNTKDIALAFLDTCALGDPREAYDKYVAPSFIHHNPYFKGDRESLLTAMVQASKDSPNLSFKVFQVITEGEKVMTHSHVEKKDMKIAVVHIMRFEEMKIVELWDLAQVLDKDSLNEHGPF